MASRSLGTLTIDLVARTGGFVQGMSKAERESKKWRRQVERDLKVVGDRAEKAMKAAAAAATAFTAATVALTKRGLDAVESQARFAKSLNTTYDSVTQLQKAFGDSGIDDFEASMNRLNRRLGAAELGRGAAMNAVRELNLDLQELAQMDAAERIATIADRIQEVATNSQTAARYAQDLGFEQREAAAFFLQGGDAVRGYADQVDRLGLSLSDIDAQRVIDAKNAMGIFGDITDGVSQSLAANFAPLLSAAADGLTDLAIEAGGVGLAVDDMFDRTVVGAIGVVSSLRSILTLLTNSVQGIWTGYQTLPPWAQEVGVIGAVLAGKKGIAVVAGLSYALKDLETSFEWFKMWREGLIDFQALVDTSPNEARRIMEQMGREIGKVEIEGPSLFGVLSGIDEGENEEWAERMIARYREIQEESRKSAEQTLKHWQGVRAGLGRDDDEGAPGSALGLIEKEISAIERAAKTWGMSADEVKLYGLEVQGATEAQIEYARGLLETVRGLEEAKEEQAAYLRLVRDLRTDEERLSDQFHERIAVLDAVAASARIAGDEYARLASRAAEAAFSDAPEFAGLAPEVGGAFGELARIDDARQELQNWYDTQLEMLEGFRSERADLNELWDDQEAALYQEHQERLARIEKSRQAAQLKAASNLFGELAGLTKAYAGEQSGIYRAMFAAEKAYSLASILVNSYDAIAKAWASAPFPANLPAVASATASTGALTAAAQVVSIQGMAHDGIDSIPETGTWLLERGERVTTAETSAKLDRTLDEIRSGQGGGEVHVNIINNAPVNIRRGEVYYDGDRRQMDIIIEAVTQAMDDGRLDDAGARNWGVNRASGAR